MAAPPGLESELTADPDIMWGALCFKGTRVPLTVFLDCLASGVSSEEFLASYPSVSQDEISAVLDWQKGTREGGLRDVSGHERL